MEEEVIATESAIAPSSSNNASGVPPPSNPYAQAIKRLMDATPEPAGGASSTPAAAADGVPSTEDALQAAGDVAAAQRRFFDFRRAMQTAMRVLTKERTFLPAESPPGDASAEIGDRTDDTKPDEQRPATRPIGLSGHTSTVAMPEVLGFLAQLRKSGTLWIWNEHDHYRVQLVDGNVTFARSESGRQGSLLGEILISQGAIDAARFEEFMAKERPPGPMGDALIAAGLVTKQALCTAVQHQAQCVFDRAFGLEDAYFRFDASEGLDTPVGIRISVTQMLFESARERDESERRLTSIQGSPAEGE